MNNQINRLFFHFALAGSFILISATGFSQSFVFEIANCNGENRAMLYNKQLSNIMFGLTGKSKFSKDDSVLLKDPEQKIRLFKKSLPPYYFDDGANVIRLDTKPNESGRIWFDNIFAEQDIKGNFKIYCGFKALFDGTDAEVERKHPKINQIIILLNKNQLHPYYDKIRKLLAANGTTMPLPQKRNLNADQGEKPPEVDKLEN